MNIKNILLISLDIITLWCICMFTILFLISSLTNSTYSVLIIIITISTILYKHWVVSFTTFFIIILTIEILFKFFFLELLVVMNWLRSERDLSSLIVIEVLAHYCSFILVEKCSLIYHV